MEQHRCLPVFLVIAVTDQDRESQSRIRIEDHGSMITIEDHNQRSGSVITKPKPSMGNIETFVRVWREAPGALRGI